MRRDCHCSIFLAAALSSATAAASDVVESSGRDNHAIISQALLSGHDLHLRQDGRYNLAEIVQRSRDNRGFVEQSQDIPEIGETMVRLQLVRISQLGIGGDVHLRQTGRNEALVLQAVGSIDTASHLLQVGDGNQLGVTQAGSRQLAGIFQIGDGNRAKVSQAEPTSSEVAEQARSLPSLDFPAIAAIDFFGANSAALIVQEGDAQEAQSLQSASSSSSIIHQVDGERQSASAWQDGDSASFIYQAGAANFAAVTQYGDGQSSFVQQSGSGNQARIVQGDQEPASGSATSWQRNVP